MASALNVTPLSYQNGIFVSSTKYPDISVIKNLDLPHVMHMDRGHSRATNLGLLEPWILSDYIKNKPMFADLMKPDSVIEVSNPEGAYTWQVPYPAEDAYVVEDISGQAKPGIGGVPFKIRFNKYITGHSGIIKFSQTAEIDFVVLDYEQIDTFYDYTLRIRSANSNDKYALKQFLVPGTRIYVSSSSMGEYDRKYNELNNSNVNGGLMTFRNYTGNEMANVHYTVTKEAALATISGETFEPLKRYDEMLTAYEFMPGTPGYLNATGAQSPSEIYLKLAATREGAKQMMQEHLVAASVIPMMEHRAKMQVISDCYNDAMWGSGGKNQTAGGSYVMSSVGLWQQMQYGNIHSFNIENFSLRSLEAKLTELLMGKIEPFGSNKPTITFKTGMAGLLLIKNALRQEYNSLPLLVQESRYVTGTGHNMNLDLPDFVSYSYFPMANVRFERDPSFDPITRSEPENPKVATSLGNYHLSSYIFMCSDLSGEGANIAEIRRQGNWDISQYVSVGRLEYPGFYKGESQYAGFIGNADPENNRGFKVYFEKNKFAYWVKDPSKALIFRPFNKVTGRPIYSNAYTSVYPVS